VTLSCQVSHNQITVAPGQNAVWRVTVDNSTDKSAEIQASVVGVKPEWVDIAPATLNLQPQQQAAFVVTVTPSIEVEEISVDTALALRLTSPQIPDWTEERRLNLRVTAADEFSLGPLIPREQELPWYRRQIRFILPVANNCGRPLRFRLRCGDEESRCRVTFSVPDAPHALQDGDTLTAEPWLTTFVNVYIRPARRRLFGLGKQDYYCTITATKLEQALSRRSLLARIHSAPLLNPLNVAFFLLCLLIIGGLTLRALNEEAFLDLVERLRVPVPVSTPASESHLLLPPVLRVRKPPIGPGLPAGSTYQDMFVHIGADYGLDWQLLAQQAYLESRLDPHAVGQSNEMGLMQIMPATWDEWAPKVGASDPFDAYENTKVAAAYMATIKHHLVTAGFTQDYWVLVAYNWGPRNLQLLLMNGRSWGEIPERSRQYAMDVVWAGKSGAPLPVPMDQIPVAD
jgi:hypothetical protein